MATTNLKRSSIGFIEIQSGNGTPNHVSSKGSIYTDVNSGLRYKNLDNSINWVLDDVYLTGGTYSSGVATFSNNIGGTFNVSGFSSGSTNGNILAITELTASTIATYSVPSSSNFTAVNLSSDTINRYAKVTFIAPTSGNVMVEMNADIVFLNSAAVMMFGLHSSSTTTTTPDKGWFRINGDADGSSATYFASFRISSLTPGITYNYYLMSVCDFSGNIIRCGSQQLGAYVASSDRPSPMRISVIEIPSTIITTNPTS